MAISVDLKLFPSFSPPHLSPLYLPSSKVTFSRLSFMNSQESRNGAHNYLQIKPQSFGNKRDILTPSSLNKDTEGRLLDSVNKSFSERLSLAWQMLFPSTTTRKNSNASIAKQRLKMILYSDRCEVSDKAKQKIVSSIVEALSDFVEIEAQDKVQLNVSTDPGLGTVYSVIVPVRRVKPGYQDSEDDYRGTITSIEYKDKGDVPGSVDVKFSFFVPDEK